MASMSRWVTSSARPPPARGAKTAARAAVDGRMDWGMATLALLIRCTTVTSLNVSDICFHMIYYWTGKEASGDISNARDPTHGIE